MNIFYINEDPKIASLEHCDKHAVKMCVEYAQLLSTAHRLLDGKEFVGKSKTGRNVKRWDFTVIWHTLRHLGESGIWINIVWNHI